MSLFVRLTLGVALAVIALIVLFFVLKVVFIGAIVAGIAVAGLYGVRLFRRLTNRGAYPLVRR